MSGHSGTFALKVKLRNKFQNNNTKIFLTPYSKFIDPLFLQTHHYVNDFVHESISFL